jgi:hypothetical protein
MVDEVDDSGGGGLRAHPTNGLRKIACAAFYFAKAMKDIVVFEAAEQHPLPAWRYWPFAAEYQLR